jgi:hypothetical protein
VSREPESIRAANDGTVSGGERGHANLPVHRPEDIIQSMLLFLVRGETTTGWFSVVGESRLTARAEYETPEWTKLEMAHQSGPVSFKASCGVSYLP